MNEFQTTLPLEKLSCHYWGQKWRTLKSRQNIQIRNRLQALW